MKKIEKVLKALENCLQNNQFESIETEKIELKDLSTGGSWKQLYISACAFLNTDGGIIIVGVNEKNKKYKLTGYDEGNENKIKDLRKKFTNEKNKNLDLADYFPAFEIHNLLDKKVCVIYVENLPEDKKFVFYEKTAYKRQLTGDHKISEEKIKEQNELKLELRDARELTLVKKAAISDLNVDKLNNYLILLNKDVKVETIKADINSAYSFLNKKGFVRDDIPTLLGMLVCGDDLVDFIEKRCEVDCYVDSTIQIAQNKQILKDNVIPLMEGAVRFVYKNIQVGVSPEKGGRDLPEYPEKLIREIINNALAHRDYSINSFVVINIKPNNSIEVRNPGSFREEQKIYIDDEANRMKIRRIIPIAKPSNPKLADILKVFDKWEGRSIGMSSLTNACLDNETDVPYYFFRAENDIGLVVSKGKVLDEEAKMWLNSYSGYIFDKCNKRELTEEEKIILTYLYKSERLNWLERYTILLTTDNNHFSAIADLEAKGLIYKYPGSSRIHPIYLVDRVLSKNDFTEELSELFGEDYDVLTNDYKKILNAIYLFDSYSRQKVISANLIGNFIYHKEHIVIRDLKAYENYKRKVRNIFNKLEEKEFINRSKDGKPQFIINKSYIPKQSYLKGINA